MKALATLLLGSALAAQLAACADTSSDSPPSTSGDGAGAAGMSDGAAVNGSSITTFVLEHGTVMMPDDLSTTPIAALVPDGTGGWKTLAGRGKADGTFSIPNVPMGTYYLQLGDSSSNDYLITSARVLDLGEVALGRPDVDEAMDASTTFSPSVSGLSPWGGDDHIEMFSPNADALSYDITAPMTAPKPGDTSASGNKLVYMEYFDTPNLIDAAKADVTYLFQLSTRQTPVMDSYTALSKAISGAATTIRAALDNPVAGALADVPMMGFSTHFADSQFEKIAAAASTRASISGASFNLMSQPGGLSYGDFSDGADLLEFWLAPAAGDKDSGALAYGNPFPASWGTYGYFQVQFNVAYTIPGVASQLNLPGSASYTADLNAVNGGSIAPAVGPVLNLTINGKPAGADLSGITTTPTIRFEPPATGTAHSYEVRLLAVTTAAGMPPTTRRVALFRTQGTSVTVPPGILVSGTYYICKVTSLYAPKDVFDAPGRGALPHGDAASFSGLLLP